jgi:hypothetical protein
MPDEVNVSPPHEELDEDTKALHAMGYAQELSRSMSRFSNFAISFTIISILSGCLTLYGYGLNHGGPPTMLWGWLIVGVIVIFVAMSMAESLLVLPHGRRSLLLGRQARAGKDGAGVVLVRRLVQPARADRRHGRHQFRVCVLRLRVPQRVHGQ